MSNLRVPAFVNHGNGGGARKVVLLTEREAIAISRLAEKVWPMLPAPSEDLQRAVRVINYQLQWIKEMGGAS